MAWYAYYDSDKDKIVGATPGTLVYYHEEGHQKQFRSGQGQFIQMWGGNFLMATVYLLAVKAYYVYPLISATLMLWCLVFFLELDAWAYAFKKMKDSECQSAWMTMLLKR